MRLYDLTNNYRQVLDLIEEGDERFLNTLESIDEAIEDKVENYGKVIKSVEAGIEGLKGEVKRLTERIRFMENSVKRMKQNVQESMIQTGKKKIKGQLFTFAIQKNPPSVEVLDEKHVPQGFWIPQEPKLNKKEIMEELKLGHEVPGVELKQTESLRIR